MPLHAWGVPPLLAGTDLDGTRTVTTPALTAVICFANEGDEVEATVRGLRQTCGDGIDILLIDDASDDGRDYESVADAYGCRFFQNSEQIGPAHSRQKGIQWAKTENVILLDAHMRFYGENWHNVVNDTIETDPNALYCTQSRPLKTGGIDSGGIMGLGASVTGLEATFEASLKSKWNTRPLGDTGTAYIPCVLGGCYAMRRDFMNHIGGYRGLHRYGCEEPLISIKAWLSGGSCKLINEVEIGHIYRDSAGAPWHDKIRYQHFNKLVTARILMDDDEYQTYLHQLEAVQQAQLVKDVYRSREAFTLRAREGFQAVRQRPLSDFWRLNQDFLEGEPIHP